MAGEFDAHDALGERGSPEADRHLAENFGMTVNQVRDFDPQTLDVTRACKFLGLPLKRFDLLATQPDARSRWVETVARQRKDLIGTFPAASTEMKEMLEAIRKFALRKCLKPDGSALVDGGRPSSGRSAAGSGTARNVLIGGGVFAAALVAIGVLVLRTAAPGERQAGPDARSKPAAEQPPAPPPPAAAVPPQPETADESRGGGTGTPLSPGRQKSDQGKAGDGVAEGERWTPLFNGRDLSGWRTHPDQPGGWTVEDGLLTGRSASGRSSHHLFTDSGQYDNFHLRAECRTGRYGDSGILFRCPYDLDDRKTSPPLCYEAQILHEFPKQQFPVALTGSLLKKPRLPKQLGYVTTCNIETDQWFDMEIIARGPLLKVRVNGRESAGIQDDQYSRGCFCLQATTNKPIKADTIVQFRKIEVTVLPQSK